MIILPGIFGYDQGMKKMNRFMMSVLLIIIFPLCLSCEESNLESKLWGVWSLNTGRNSEYTWKKYSSMGQFYTASANSITYEFNNIDMVMSVGMGEGLYPIVSFRSEGDTVFLEVTRRVGEYFNEEGMRMERIVPGLVAVHFISENEIWLETIEDKSDPRFPGMLFGGRNHTFLRARKVEE